MNAEIEREGQGVTGGPGTGKTTGLGANDADTVERTLTIARTTWDELEELTAHLNTLRNPDADPLTTEDLAAVALESGLFEIGLKGEG